MIENKMTPEMIEAAVKAAEIIGDLPEGTFNVMFVGEDKADWEDVLKYIKTGRLDYKMTQLLDPIISKLDLGAKDE